MSYAYVTGQITVKNPGKWNEYCSRVPDTLAPWGAEIVFRGKKIATFAGGNLYTDIVVIRFPDTAAAHNWFASPSYQSLIPLRQQAADVVLLAYET